MPGFLGGGGGGGGGTGGQISFPKEFIDPVTKFRVSQPENLIDTDFEYGLQPTKWETVELINNTPSFFSKSGDTSIDGIISITTNAGTREITVTTALDHNLAAGIPINVTGTKSLTADGSFIIASIPNPTTFTYLCKANQNETLSINDLYTSIITGEFFQGSQVGINDSEGILTDGTSTSLLTIKTKSTHGFGIKTPLYLLNINSTISQDFQSANTATRSFDASNSATAQTFDGSNTLSTINIDLSNSGVESSKISTVVSVSTTENTITVSHGTENFSGLKVGTPVYYDVISGTGYFAQNPRGVVFLKTTSGLSTSFSTFKVSQVPDGDELSIEASISGTFQLSDLSRTFAGNNINLETQTDINVVLDENFLFDGANVGYTGVFLEGQTPPNNTSTVVGFTSDSITVTGSQTLDYYVGAMVFYNSTGSAAAGLTNNTTYFIKTFSTIASGLYSLSISALPGGATVTGLSGGTGTQTFAKIGVSIDKDIFHIKDSNFSRYELIEYTSPVGGAFGANFEQKFYYVDTVYDTHNYKLDEKTFIPITATGGTILPNIYSDGRFFRAHSFTSVGESNFVVQVAPQGAQVEYLIVAGGGGGGMDMGGGGGGGGVIAGTTSITAGTYPVVVGAGGAGAPTAGFGAGTQGIANHVYTITGTNGGNSSWNNLTAIGGGRGGMSVWSQSNLRASGQLGGSGGGASGYDTPNNLGAGAGTAGQGFAGGAATGAYWSGGGGGAGGVGGKGSFNGAPFGGPGVSNGILGTTYFWGGGGGGSGYSGTGGNGGIGGGGGGAVGSTSGGAGLNNGSPGGGGSINSQTNRPGGNAGANTGGGGGGGSHYTATNQGGNGGSGIVVIRYPITPPPNGDYPVATGGAISTITVGNDIYAVHQFRNTGSQTFTVTLPGSAALGSNILEYMVVGGGGSGGSDMGGGGGAGGYLAGTVEAQATTYTVVVGAGGSGNNAGIGNRRGFEGAASSLVGGSTNLVARGGGGGASCHDRSTSPAGGVNIGLQVGSGGGASGGGTLPSGGSGGGGYGGGIRGTGTPGQGNDGGSGIYAWYPGSGGGSAGPGTRNPPIGGPGTFNDILGVGYYWAAGGGGSNYSAFQDNRGGIGGGGGGAHNNFSNGGTGGINPGLSGGGGNINTQANVPGGAAGANTGSGGGGGSHYSSNNFGGAGGSGIVVIRYKIGTVS
jgi:hypothetical protein